MKRKEGKSKKQARLLCILLSFVMLLGMLPMTALAADETTYITEVTITGMQTPVVGQPCSVDTIVVTTNPANAYITEGTGAVNIYWYDDTDGVKTNQTDTFIDGHSYHLSVCLEPKEGYAFGFDYSSIYELKPYTGTATVNGKKAYSAETLSGSNTGLFVGSDGGIVPVEAPTTYGITVTNGRASIGTGSEITSASENDVITLTADTAPEGKTFDKWVVDEGSTAITLADMNSASTTFTMPAGAVSITAMYKDIQHSGGDNDPVYYTLTFDKNGGSGSMADVKVDKGSMYSLPACKFTAPAGKEFKAWEVGGVEKAVGDSIAVNADTKVKALWTKASNPQQPYKPTDTDVIGGDDRIDTAGKISKKYYSYADNVIIARKDDFPDALTASVLAKALNAPILLTDTDKLDKRVAAELKRLGVKKAYIIGRENAISEFTESEIKKITGATERIGGSDRFETSSLVAKKVVSLVGKKGKAVVATGLNFADSLSISPYAAKMGYPILLVKQNKVPEIISETIKDLSINEVYIVGGDSAVSVKIEEKLPKLIKRIGGLNRYETSAKIADEFFTNSKKAFMASGQVFADALVIGPVAANENAPVLLTMQNKLPKAIKANIDRVNYEKITIVGLENAVSKKVIEAINSSSDKQ